MALTVNPYRPHFLAKRVIGFHIIGNPFFITILDPLQMRQKTVIFGKFIQTRLTDMGQKINRISSGFYPKLRFNTPKQRYCILFPAPPEISRQHFQKGQRFGYRGIDLVCENAFHGCFPMLRQSLNGKSSAVAVNF